MLSCFLFFCVKVIAQESNQQVIKTGGFIIVKVFDNPPLYFRDQRNESFKILKPYLTPNTLKASVVWQKDIYSFGSLVSIPNVYIKSYLKHTNSYIKERKFVSLFNIEEIEPDPFLNVNCSIKVDSKSISEADSKRIYELVEKAEIYRLSKEYDSALRIYSEILDINANDVIALYWTAEIYKAKNNIVLAKEYYQKAIDIDPCFWAANRALFDLK